MCHLVSVVVCAVVLVMVVPVVGRGHLPRSLRADGTRLPLLFLAPPHADAHAAHVAHRVHAHAAVQ